MSAEKTEIEIFNEACGRIRSKGGLTEEIKKELKERFPKRFEEALRLALSKRVKKYLFRPSGRTIWVVVGRRGEYQVIPKANFCSCEDFYFRVIGEKKQMCYHLMAQKLAEAVGTYEEVEEKDKNYEKITAKWKLEEKVKKETPNYS